MVLSPKYDKTVGQIVFFLDLVSQFIIRSVVASWNSQRIIKYPLFEKMHDSDFFSTISSSRYGKARGSYIGRRKRT